MPFSLLVTVLFYYLPSHTPVQMMCHNWDGGRRAHIFHSHLSHALLHSECDA